MGVELIEIASLSALISIGGQIIATGKYQNAFFQIVAYESRVQLSVADVPFGDLLRRLLY